MGLGVMELGVIVIGLVFSLAPLAVAIWAIVAVSGMRSQVEALERRVALLERGEAVPPPS